MSAQEKLNYLRYQRGYTAGYKGRPPSESWTPYLEGYHQGKRDAEPGARWRSKK